MKQLLYLLILLLSFYTANAQNKCAGGDTLCLNNLADTTICSGLFLDYVPTVSSSVNGATANFTYKWTNLNSNSTLSLKDSLQSTFTAGSITNIDVELCVTYTNGATYEVKDTFRVTINPLPNININKPYLTQACFGPAIYLNAFGTTPIGGTWHHWDDTTAVNGNYFYPDSVGDKATTKDYNITYISTTAKGCVDSAHTKIKILRLPPVQLKPIGPLCENEGVLLLEQFIEKPLLPNLGNNYWESLTYPNAVSNGSSGYRFDPYGGLKGAGNPNIIKYTFTDLVSGCSDYDTAHIIVNHTPSVTYTNPSEKCASGKPLNLDSVFIINPKGGKWTCKNCNGFNPIIDDSISFDPSFKPLGYTYNLQYNYHDGHCPAAVEALLRTTEVPIINATADDYDICDTAISINLHATPVGGFWSGPGVTDSTFYIADGIVGDTNTLSYFYYDPTLNCNNTEYIDIVIWEKPEISLGTDITTICDTGSGVINFGKTPNKAMINWSHNGFGTYTEVDTTLTYFAHIKDTLTGVTFEAIVTNNYCPSDTASITFQVDNCSKLSISPIEHSTISIYPNPANDLLHLNKPDNNSYKVQLISADGKLKSTYNWDASNASLTINTSNKPAGIYYIVVTNSNGNMFYEKLVIE